MKWEKTSQKQTFRLRFRQELFLLLNVKRRKKARTMGGGARRLKRTPREEERESYSEVVLAGGDHLEGEELVAALLEALDDLADESALDAVGLDGDEGAFFLGRGHGVRGVGCRGRRTDGGGGGLASVFGGDNEGK